MAYQPEDRRGREMGSTFRMNLVLMILSLIILLSIFSTFQVEALSNDITPSMDQEEDPEAPNDWFAVFCCIFVMVIAIGFPIAIIVFITKIIQGATKKKQEDPKWRNYHSPGGRMKTQKPARIQIPRRRNWDEKGPVYPHGTLKVKNEVKDDLYGLKKRKEPQVEEEVIEMDLAAEEEDMEPEMPKFERPKALSDEEKDDFIVDRILELQSMLNDGEIDKEIYEQLKKRLLDQIED